jgi:hypothetical protein
VTEVSEKKGIRDPAHYPLESRKIDFVYPGLLTFVDRGPKTSEGLSKEFGTAIQ